MRKQAIAYIARVMIQKLIGLLLYAVGAGFVFTYAGCIYFLYLFIATLVISIILLHANEETLAERGKVKTNAPKWDKVLLLLFCLLNYFLVYFCAGISEKQEHLNGLYWTGILMTVFAAWFSTKATLENTYLESTARIQTDRNQTVCTTGPYRVVRHPAYSGLLLNCVGLCLIFPSVIVWGCMLVTAVIVVIRTVLEDRMLRAGLDGYTDYAEKTRYRLVPFVW